MASAIFCPFFPDLRVFGLQEDLDRNSLSRTFGVYIYCTNKAEENIEKCIS
jgi:hypothetical protein